MNQEEYLELLIPLTARLVATVHDEGPDATEGIINAINAVPVPDDVEDPHTALVILLAAMVDPNKSPRALLAWTLGLPDDGLPHIDAAPSNPLSVEMGVSGVLPFYALNRNEKAQVVEILMDRGMTRPQIVEHTRGESQDVCRFHNTIVKRRERQRASA